MTTLGDMIYGGDAGTPTRLAGDTSDARKFLGTTALSGAATAPIWSYSRSVSIETGSYLLGPGDDTVVFDLSSSAIATLPTASGVQDQEYYVSNDFTSSSPLTIDTTSGESVGGRASGSIILSAGDYLHVVSDGVNWRTLDMHETVVASYQLTGTQTMPGAPAGNEPVYSSVLDWNDKLRDTHSAMASGTWTCPVTGTYVINLQISISGSGTQESGSFVGVVLEIGGTPVAQGGIFSGGNGQYGEAVTLWTGTLAAGATVTSYGYNNGGATTYTIEDDMWSTISIVRVGN